MNIVPCNRYSTSLILSTKIDSFLHESHATTTFTGISHSSCSNGDNLGFTLLTSASNFTSYRMTYQLLRDNSLGTWSTKINSIFTFARAFPATTDFFVRILGFSLESDFLPLAHFQFIVLEYT